MDQAPYDLVVRGTLVLPDRNLPCGWLAVAGGRIAAIGEGEAPAAAQLHDAGNDFVMPGAIDGQTHATSARGRAGFESTTRSAVAGGVTTLVDMPYDNPDPLTTIELLEAKVAAIETQSHADVALYATVAPGHGAGALVELAAAGACAIKISSMESHPVRFPRVGGNDTLDILTAAAGLKLPVGLHNEDQEIVRGSIAALKAKGLTTPEWHEPSRPVAAELAATANFLALGMATGAHVHLVHVSCPEGFAVIRAFQEMGVTATSEMPVHYLHFDAARDIARLGARMKVSPPIRPGVLPALWGVLLRDEVAFISSDHSSGPIDNKLTDSIFDAGAGIPGLETLVPSFYTDLVGKVPAPERTLAQYLGERPARFFGLWPKKGSLIVGADADIMVLRPGPIVFEASRTHDELNWSPYDGETFQARIAATFLRGDMVWDGSVVTGREGQGRYVRHQG
ncbi:MAG: dihydroorotase [Sphingomonas sp.]|uniref:dihydroorotase n=1 Tax=Sphingomonas sp. TaxID=28214 RepID=UPI003F7E4AAE